MVRLVRKRLAMAGLTVAAVALVVLAALSAPQRGALPALTAPRLHATQDAPPRPPGQTSTTTAPSAAPSPQAVIATPAIATLMPLVLADVATPITYTYRVVAAYPHDTGAFTQGLQWIDGELFEGTGLRGRSSLRRVDLETGDVLQQVDLDNRYFGEGITVVGDRIFQLTWQEGVGFIYDRTTFARIGEFTYATEGWGLTYDGQHLLMTDGTATLYRLDPETLTVVGEVEVREGETPIPRLNELEMVGDELFANIWLTDRIARINPITGQITGWIDLMGLLDHSPYPPAARVDVLNGIAYDAAADRLFVTGKLWPALFEIELIAP